MQKCTDFSSEFKISLSCQIFEDKVIIPHYMRILVVSAKINLKKKKKKENKSTFKIIWISF